MKVLLVIFVGIAISTAKPHLNADTCLGYDSCPLTDDSKINIHLIPHSHNDLGWLETMEHYFYDQVQTTISSVIPALLEDPERRYIQVETANFHMWYRDQSEGIRQTVTKLVNEGRLEIANGGWSMNDEAMVHYQSTIDQFTLGLRYVQDTIGKCARPTVGWQIDPFGHSREQASIYSQMGYDSIYFARMDYRDRAKRKQDKTLDLLWTGSSNLGSDSNIFTSAFTSDSYGYPGGFCFDIRCGDAQIVIDEESPMYNWDTRVNDFLGKMEERISFFDNNNHLIPIGNDFNWEAAERNYRNFDKLIKGFRKFNPKINGKEINIFYSTPSCYAKAVNDHVIRNNKTLDVKTDDFIPYADNPGRYWGGILVARPTSKRYERQCNNILQASKQLKAFADLAQNATRKLEEAVAVMQHHDAMPGTERSWVEKDYHRILYKGASVALEEDNVAFTKLLNHNLNLVACPLANVSICSGSSKDEFNVLLYNPLGKPASHYIHVPVKAGTWKVTGPGGHEVESSTTDRADSFSYITANTSMEVLDVVLIFHAQDLPAMGYKVYNFKKMSTIMKPIEKLNRAVDQMGFEDTYVNFDTTTGLLKAITIKNKTVEVSQEIMFYKSSEADGPYIFQPDPNDHNAKSLGPVTTTTLINEGNLVREVKQVWNDWTSQTIRIYKEEDFIEFDWLIGPINVDDQVSKTIISRFSTNLMTNGEFYTDSNGREMIYRKKDYRPTFNYTFEENEAGNYFPVTSKILIKDDTKQFALINDRGQGGASLNDGQVELMIHKGVLTDGHGILGEHLYEEEYNQGVVARGSIYVTFGDIVPEHGAKAQTTIEKNIEQRKHLTPLMLFTDKAVEISEEAFLDRTLPENVHFLTLDKWNDGEMLIRLEHFLEKDTDPWLSVDAEVDLTDFFAKFSITSMKEYTLGANEPLEESARLEWPQIVPSEPTDSILRKEVRLQRNETDLVVKLAPMQIRTFIAQITWK